MFITNRYTMIYIPIFVNIVLLLLFGYRYLFFSLISVLSSLPQASGRNIKQETPKPLDFGVLVRPFGWWELRESNPRPSACKADALNQLS